MTTTTPSSDVTFTTQEYIDLHSKQTNGILDARMDNLAGLFNKMDAKLDANNSKLDAKLDANSSSLKQDLETKLKANNSYLANKFTGQVLAGAGMLYILFEWLGGEVSVRCFDFSQPLVL
jgi:hypothetical protein